MIAELKKLIRQQYGWQNKVKVIEFLMIGITNHAMTKEYRFLRRVRDMYIAN